jgi:hypothetical protein
MVWQHIVLMHVVPSAGRQMNTYRVLLMCGDWGQLNL